jgi:effector-binding domain-containing protein
MIHHMGVRTTQPELVAYKTLEPDESEAVALAELNSELRRKGARPREPTMIVFLDQRDAPSCRREVMIPVERKVEGVKTKTLPSMKAGFVVYSGTEKPIDYYYEILLKHIEERGLRPSGSVCSIEAVYPPEQMGLSYGSFIDEDAHEQWKTEIIIPVED